MLDRICTRLMPMLMIMCATVGVVCGVFLAPKCTGFFIGLGMMYAYFVGNIFSERKTK